MNLLFALVAAAIAWGIYPAGVIHTPLAQLTLDKVAALVMAAVCASYALKELSKSFEEDGIWPWHWKSWRDPATLLIRGALLCAMAWLLLVISDQLSGLKAWAVYGIAACYALWIMFTIELRIRSPEEKALARNRAPVSPSQSEGQPGGQ
jgi:hypothetical protein